MDTIPKKQIAILGSTGSIGTQALEVIADNASLFEVYALTANNNVDLLIQQARKFTPEMLAIGNEKHYNQLKNTTSCQLYASQFFSTISLIA